MNLHGNSAGEVGRDIKPTTFGKQALVLTELSHVSLALVGRTDTDDAVQFAEPAHSDAHAFGRIIATVGDARGIQGIVCVGEILQARRSEPLITNIQRNPKGIM